MFFEATLGTDTGDKDFKIEINETRKSWKINLQEASHDWVRYEIAKEDYMTVENIITLIWGGGSYVIDVYGSDIDYTVYTRSSYRNVRIYNDEALLHESLKKGGLLGGGGNLVAGMPGKIVKTLVKVGDLVKVGQPLLIMEAMKMENEMRATAEVKIKDILVNPSDSVESGQTLIVFESIK